MLNPVIVEFIKMDQKHAHLSYDWTQVFTPARQDNISLLDRTLPALGDILIRAGMRLKQRPSTLLGAEKAQAPNFIIML